MLDTGAVTFSGTSRDVQTALIAGDPENQVMDLLFRKMDRLALSDALNRLLPTVAKSDGKAKYLAISLNIQIAAMTAGYLVLVCTIFVFYRRPLTNLRMQRAVDLLLSSPTFIKTFLSAWPFILMRWDGCIHATYRANRADWFTPRLTYHPIAVAAFLSPFYLLYWGRHYSSPMQFHEIFLVR